MASPAFLQIKTTAEQSTRVVRLQAPCVRIGSGRTCEVMLDDQNLAAVHCLLRRRGDSWQLQPLGRSELVTINDRPVSRLVSLAVGSEFNVAQFRLRISAIADEELATDDQTLAPGLLPTTAEIDQTVELQVDSPSLNRPTIPEPSSRTVDRYGRTNARIEPPQSGPRRPINPKTGASLQQWESRWRAVGESIQQRTTRTGEARARRPRSTPSGPTTSRSLLEAPPIRPAERPQSQSLGKSPSTSSPLIRDRSLQASTAELDPLPGTAAHRPAGSKGLLESTEAQASLQFPEDTVPADQGALVSGPTNPTIAGEEAPDRSVEPQDPSTDDFIRPVDLQTVSVIDADASPPDAVKSLHQSPNDNPISDLDSAEQDGLGTSLELPAASEASDSWEAFRPGESSSVIAPYSSNHSLPEFGLECLSDFQESPSSVGSEFEEPFEQDPVGVAIPITDPDEPSSDVIPVALVEPLAPFDVPETTGPHDFDDQSDPVDSTNGETGHDPTTPDALEPALGDRSDQSWPTAQSILAASEASAQRTSVRPRKQRSQQLPRPTTLQSPQGLRIPGGSVICLFLTFGAMIAGALTTSLCWEWSTGDRVASVIAGPFLDGRWPDEDELEALLELERTLPVPSWRNSGTDQILFRAGLLTSPSVRGDPAVTERAAQLISTARGTSPAHPTLQYLIAWRDTETGTRRAPGLSHDVVPLLMDADHLLEAGKEEEAKQCYRAALEMVSRVMPSSVDFPEFYPGPGVGRFGVPLEERIAVVVRAMADQREWLIDDWLPLLPDEGPTQLVVGRLLRERHEPEAAEVLRKAATLAQNSTSDGAPLHAFQLAAGAEAMALQGEIESAVTQYQSAIDELPQAFDGTRRAWWYNLADLFDELDQREGQRKALLEAMNKDPNDPVTGRAINAWFRAFEYFDEETGGSMGLIP